MNLRDLRYLIAVVDHNHFGRAAQACHVSQPTLSAQIKKLEEYLGVQLIERTQRRVQITDIGKEIVQRARLIVHEADELVDAARAFNDPFKGELRIGAIPTIGPYLFPHILRPIREKYPQLKLKLYEEKTSDIVTSLGDGKLDAAILADMGPDLFPKGRVETQELYSEAFVAAVPEEFPSPKKGRVTLTSLKAGNLLLLDEGHCLREQALDVCSRINLSENGEFRATSIETLRNMVAAGAGVTLLPELAAQGPASGVDGIRIQRFKDPEPERSVILAWRGSSARLQTIEAVSAIIKKSIKKHLSKKL